MHSSKFIRKPFECLVSERERGLRLLANIKAVNHITGSAFNSTISSLEDGRPAQQGEIRLKHNPYEDPKGE